MFRYIAKTMNLDVVKNDMQFGMEGIVFKGSKHGKGMTKFR